MKGGNFYSSYWYGLEKGYVSICMQGDKCNLEKRLLLFHPLLTHSPDLGFRSLLSSTRKDVLSRYIDVGSALCSSSLPPLALAHCADLIGTAHAGPSDLLPHPSKLALPKNLWEMVPARICSQTPDQKPAYRVTITQKEEDKKRQQKTMKQKWREAKPCWKALSLSGLGVAIDALSTNRRSKELVDR